MRSSTAPARSDAARLAASARPGNGPRTASSGSRPTRSMTVRTAAQTSAHPSGAEGARAETWSLLAGHQALASSSASWARAASSSAQTEMPSGTAATQGAAFFVHLTRLGSLRLHRLDLGISYTVNVNQFPALLGERGLLPAPCGLGGGLGPTAAAQVAEAVGAAVVAAGIDASTRSSASGTQVAAEPRVHLVGYVAIDQWFGWSYILDDILERPGTLRRFA